MILGTAIASIGMLSFAAYNFFATMPKRRRKTETEEFQEIQDFLFRANCRHDFVKAACKVERFIDRYGNNANARRLKDRLRTSSVNGKTFPEIIAETN